MSPVSGEPEAHIAGVVVHAYPEALAAVERTIAQMHAAKVHATSPDGRIVVTLEGVSAEAVAAQISRIQTFEGVLAAALVYQHSEPEAAMNDEVES